VDLNDFIKVYDNAIPLSCISSIIKWSNTQKFESAGVGSENTKNPKIRKCELLNLTNWEDKSRTKYHWCNLLSRVIWNATHDYRRTFKTLHNLNAITDISILKYSQGGFYKIHTDSFFSAPRELSFILLLNNDYQGGSLKFYNPKEIFMKKIDVCPGRLIMWPSNFLYPHIVEEVTEGTRFSIVSWVV